MVLASGFYKAPVTKVICFSTYLAYFVSSSIRETVSLNLDYARIFQNREYWRIITSNLAFESVFELIVGGILMYYFRQFERQMGSNKFCAVALVSTAMATSIQLGTLAIAPHFKSVRPGPYAFIFTFLVQYYIHTPRMYPRMFSFYIMHGSDKLLYYFLGLLLLFSSWEQSFIAGFPGILVGGLLASNKSCQLRLRMPKALSDVCRKYILPLIGSTPPSRTVGQRRRDTAHGAAPAPAAAAPPVPASEEGIAQLEAMGFSRDDAVAALQASGNNVLIAVNRLTARNRQ